MTSPVKPVDRIQHGFKKVSWANILEPDDHRSYPSGLRGAQWVRACWQPRLEPGMPEDIAFLFEVARGSMIYGLYFLPLAALATEQSLRVLEAGARHRYEQLGLCRKPPGRKRKLLPDISYAEVVAALHKAGAIADKDVDTWKSMVHLRNRFSHPTSQAIHKRHEALGQLGYVAELLNRLFK
jgi:hypothetical protein